MRVSRWRDDLRAPGSLDEFWSGQRRGAEEAESQDDVGELHDDGLGVRGVGKILALMRL